MRLDTWLKVNNKSPSAFARDIDVATSTILRILKDGRGATHSITCRIVIGTNGEVLPNDLFDLDMLLRGLPRRAKRRA